MRGVPDIRRGIARRFHGNELRPPEHGRYTRDSRTAWAGQTGSRRAGASFGPVRLERLTNSELTTIETWSEQRSSDPLIEALTARVVGRFASFLGQPPIRGTLTRVLTERCVTITGRRGDEPFEETLR